MNADAGDAGYDELLDAIAAGEGYYLACPEGHGSLPPRRVCPACGARDLTETPLPAVGEVATYTLTNVATPGFADDAPYLIAVAEFGPVRLTGQVRGIDPGDIAVGTVVGATVESRETTDERLLVFRPR